VKKEAKSSPKALGKRTASRKSEELGLKLKIDSTPLRNELTINESTTNLTPKVTPNQLKDLLHGFGNQSTSVQLGSGLPANLSLRPSFSAEDSTVFTPQNGTFT
jgi:hypothetical protein